jgi:hypothetical protein
MKLDEWEITAHLRELIGEESYAFDLSPDYILRIWKVQKGIKVYSISQRGVDIQLNIRGAVSNYFRPDLKKINQDLLDKIFYWLEHPLEMPDSIERYDSIVKLFS